MDAKSITKKKLQKKIMKDIHFKFHQEPPPVRKHDQTNPAGPPDSDIPLPPKMGDAALQELFYQCDLRIGMIEDCVLQPKKTKIFNMKVNLGDHWIRNDVVDIYR